MKPNQPSPHNAIVNINALGVHKKVKAAMMSNREEPVENIGALVFRAGFGP